MLYKSSYSKNEETLYVSNSMDQMDLKVIYRISQPSETKYMSQHSIELYIKYIKHENPKQVSANIGKLQLHPVFDLTPV